MQGQPSGQSEGSQGGGRYCQGYIPRSAAILEASTKFLTKLRAAFRKFDKFCSMDYSYKSAAVDAVEEIFNDIAEYLADIGSVYDITSIKNKNVKFASNLVDTLDKLRKQAI